MSDPFLAEIRIFPYNFPPRGWAQCDGQLLTIGQNTALFSLLGTFYGGDGRINFALPNLRGRSPLGAGQSPGLSFYSLGQLGGTPTVTLTQDTVPPHSHAWLAAPRAANARIPDATRAYASATANAYQTAAPNVKLNPAAIGLTGGGGAHNNMMPYLTLNICIAIQGVFPKRP